MGCKAAWSAWTRWLRTGRTSRPGVDFAIYFLVGLVGYLLCEILLLLLGRRPPGQSWWASIVAALTVGVGLGLGWALGEAVRRCRAARRALPVVLVQSGGVASALPCRRCGYNLYGLRVQATCPECGAPIAEALQETIVRTTTDRR